MLKKLINRAIAIPLAGLIILISPFFRIRFIQLFSSRIGHYSINTELMLCALDMKLYDDRRSKILFYTLPNEPICNTQLHKMWSRTLPIVPFPAIAAHIDALLMRFGVRKYRNYPIKSLQVSCEDKYNLLDKVKKCHLSFTAEEDIRGKSLMKELGIREGAPFVCLLVRDANYLQVFLPSNDWAYHEFRNADINNYKLAAEYLADQGYYVIRMGKFVNAPLKTNNPKIIDYANSPLRSDFMDIFLSARCFFFFSTCTGLDSVARVFRKPMLVTDLVLADFDIWHPWKLFIPKKIMNEKENRLLTVEELQELFVEMRVKKQIPKLMKERGLSYLDNTPDEIQGVTEEMLSRLRGTWINSAEDEKLQARFWKYYPKYFIGDNISQLNLPISEQIKVKVGAHFLKNNPSLLTNHDIAKVIPI